MRKKLIAGNWKMHGLRKEAQIFTDHMQTLLANQTPPTSRELLICPPFTLLPLLQAQLKGLDISLGGQNCHAAPQGAYTGEISASMLKDSGCDFVILGHSERRQYFHETNATVKAKAEAAVQVGLIPVICIGETLAQKEAVETKSVLQKQIAESLPDSGDFVLAYEPVWAIGTGKSARVGDVEETHLFIKEVVRGHCGERMGENLRILYGGSVKPENAADLLNSDAVDGALIGGASLDAQSFWNIAKA